MVSTTTSSLGITPLPLPPTADPAHFHSFGRQVDGVDLDTADDATLEQVRRPPSSLDKRALAACESLHLC